jgi:hypothetical protein
LRQRDIEDARKAGAQGGGNPPTTPGQPLARFHVPLHPITLPPQRTKLNAPDRRGGTTLPRQPLLSY